MSPRVRIIYVTPDSHRWMMLDVPDGLITPPHIDLHVPVVGPVRFYYAQSYQLPIPLAARQAITE
jgi:hypothetical protein